jgi:hypothetical protein
MKTHTRKASATAATVLLATLSLAGAAAQAADEKIPFVLTAYINGAGGESLIAGNYDAALSEVQRSRHNTLLASTYQTNLCVAQTALRHWNEARVACDAAIKDAVRNKPRGFANGSLSEANLHNTYIAIAYSNRAVVNWLSKEAVAAAEDLAKAHKLAPQADFVARNMTAFKAPHDTVRQVAVTP